jgi:hypothetical protein
MAAAETSNRPGATGGGGGGGDVGGIVELLDELELEVLELEELELLDELELDELELDELELGEIDVLTIVVRAPAVVAGGDAVAAPDASAVAGAGPVPVVFAAVGVSSLPAITNKAPPNTASKAATIASRTANLRPALAASGNPAGSNR